jgi:hypothetical protein
MFAAISPLGLLLSISFIDFTVRAADIDTVRNRRVQNIIDGVTGVSSIPSWLGSLGSDGKWPDSEVDYTSGCPAQTGSWPAQQHWKRLSTFAGAWHGGVKNAAQYHHDSTIRNAISKGMQYWFANDFTDSDCLDKGGEAACPCGTPGFWNTNWFSNIILIPGFIGEICLLLDDDLTATERGNCTKFTQRSYNTFATGIEGVSSITGSNTLDIASIAIDGALLSSNLSQLQDAYNRVHGEVQIFNTIKADGIRADGSFGQHQGILYNGNYGKDYANDYLTLEINSAQTQFEANTSSHAAFEALMEAYKWMTYGNAETGVLHWDFSVLGRFLVLPVQDNQATQNLKTNLTQIQVLSDLWGSEVLADVFDTLSSPITDANNGGTVGNRMFFANDYMVHRGANYVTSLKMYSSRTSNSECSNDQNPFGFHLSDGAMYSHVTGDEYEDITAAWDWNLIPGTTVDYGATPLSCAQIRKTSGQPFVGGVSTGKVGMAVQRYKTPTTATLNWRKTWFFLPGDIQYIMISDLTSSTTAPVFTVLDQRKHSGSVILDGQSISSSGNFSSSDLLYHGGVGYSLNPSAGTVNSTTLSLQLGAKTGDWSTIGTSKAPPVTVDMFTAWLYHANPSASTEYAIFPGVSSYSALQTKSAAAQLRSLSNTVSISAVQDLKNHVLMIAFWKSGTITVPAVAPYASYTVQANQGAAVIVDTDTWKVTLSDPSQLLTSVTLTFKLGSGTPPPGWGFGTTKQMVFTLPTGGLAGSSVTASMANA